MKYLKILIVDDIETNVALIATIIKQLNAKYETASDGQKALELVDSFQPDIVLLDLMMPQIDGWKIIKRIREKYAKEKMAIIVTTAITDHQAIKDCLELGANDYMTKPIMPQKLLDIIQLNALKLI